MTKQIYEHVPTSTHCLLRRLAPALLAASLIAACGDDDDDNGDGGSSADSGGGTVADSGGGTVADSGPGPGADAGGDAGSGNPDAGGADAGPIDGGPGDARCAPDNGGIVLPDGFCAAVVARSLGRARQMTVSPSGDLFVAIGPTPSGSNPGRIVSLRDTNGDGRADIRRNIGQLGGNGVAWRNGQLYLAANDRVLRYPLPDGRLVPTGPAEVIVSGLPATGDHPAKTIVFADDGDIILNIGSASNSCQERNRRRESPGIDPCPELDERAGLFRFADQPGQTAADGVRFAMGVRNANALTTHPETGAVIGAINGRDELFQDWPDFYTLEDDRRLPSEEMGVFAQGQDWGWPYCYHDAVRGEKMLAPEYGGDGETIGRCEAVQEPLYAFPAHWAPLAIAIYNGTAFPERYRGGAFVTFHGSHYEPQPEGELPGYNVSFLPLDGTAPAGDFEIFASDFAGPERPLPQRAQYRPVGVAEAPDGSLYISSDRGGTIWRIFYIGE
jgi:glucose/arabinose dehydrogenase